MKTRILIPVKTEEELEDLQYTLAEIIHLLSHCDQVEQQKNIHWFSKILLYSFMLDE
ncbi:hypothetical protein ACSTS3_08315 [Aquimarina muelleri]|uniref:hypothetical protein n=1 Tax=Aquimarina muelleri TaxID=279356 RepID=UPI003F689344